MKENISKFIIIVTLVCLSCVIIGIIIGYNFAIIDCNKNSDSLLISYRAGYWDGVADCYEGTKINNTRINETNTEFEKILINCK